jgi:hypothetical protein
MTLRRVAIAIILLGLLQLAWRWDRRAVEHEPGILVPDAPSQSATDAPPFRFRAFTIEPKAAFELYARVLSTERYRFDAGARVSPVDLALGWGPMSDQALVDQLDISQGARWFTLAWESPPAAPELLMRHSANMHMIPAEEWVEDILTDARVGQIVRIEGYLVRVSDDSGWSWNSSLTRDDTGDGSCELVFVEQASIMADPLSLTRAAP